MEPRRRMGMGRKRGGLACTTISMKFGVYRIEGEQTGWHGG